MILDIDIPPEDLDARIVATTREVLADLEISLRSPGITANHRKNLTRKQNYMKSVYERYAGEPYGLPNNSQEGQP